ncbi:MAG: helix-turn-helix domain-containing protein [Candidatus Pacearchaeota archaeon]|nr:helix-turn-helix domain-containing protein [Candidatus Pacearchaeota archaeon]
MVIVNEITIKIIKNAKEGESIRSLANRIGFAYSAVYNWVLELEKYDVIKIIRKGNKNAIKINKNQIYKKFIELESAVSVIEKDNEFWELVKSTKLRIRFVKGTAITIWTKGSFITGDFYDKIYSLEADSNDIDSLKKILIEKNITYTKDKLVNKRPLVYLSSKNNLKIEKIDGLPIMPLKELINYCKRLYLDNVLEQLDLLYNLNLNKRYSEVYTNMGK